MSFIVSKIVWLFFSPSSFLVLLLLLGAFLSVGQKETHRVVGRRISFAMAMVFFFIAIFPVGEWLLLPLENRFPPAKLDHVDGIILVGEDENAEVTEARGQPVLGYSADDYIVFSGLARQYPEAKLVYTGGSGLITPFAQMGNAQVARSAFEAIGLPVDRIVFEDKSRTTHENAIDAAAIVHPAKGQKWLLVTSAMHMPRSMATFRKEGWTVYPAPASYVTSGEFSLRLRFALGTHLSQLTLAMHEYVGLLAYRLEGYTDEIWPK